MASHWFFVVMGLLVGVVMTAFGVAMTWFGVQRYRNRRTTLDRVESVEGTVTTSYVNRSLNANTGGSKYEYRPIIRFRYEYSGQTYESNRHAYDMLFSSSGGRTYAEKYTHRYPEGETVQVYVDPEDPANGFLEVKETKQGLATIAILVLGLGGLAMGITSGAVGVGVFILFQ